MSDRKFVGNILGGRAAEVDDAYLKYWNQVTPGNAGKWGSVERQRDEMDWETLDVIYRTCVERGIPLKQHTFVWGMQQPDWIEALSPAEQREEVTEWIRAFCERYPDVAMIDVVNEPITIPAKQYKDALGGDGKTGWDWVIWAFEQARSSAPNAVLILNEHSILKDDEKLRQFAGIVRLLQERNLIDAVGLQAHFLERTPPEDIERRLDEIAALGLPVYISEFDLNIGDDAVQKAKYQAIFPIFWEHAAVKGVTLWGYKEGEMWRTEGYLLHKDGSERPALQWLGRYLQQ